jgi:hypothetical protein
VSSVQLHGEQVVTALRAGRVAVAAELLLFGLLLLVAALNLLELGR